MHSSILLTLSSERMSVDSVLQGLLDRSLYPLLYQKSFLLIFNSRKQKKYDLQTFWTAKCLGPVGINRCLALSLFCDPAPCRSKHMPRKVMSDSDTGNIFSILSKRNHLGCRILTWLSLVRKMIYFIFLLLPFKYFWFKVAFQEGLFSFMGSFFFKSIF